MKYWLLTFTIVLFFGIVSIKVRQSNPIHKKEIRLWLAGDGELIANHTLEDLDYEDLLKIINNSISLKAKPEISVKSDIVRFQFDDLFEKNSWWAIELQKESNGFSLSAIEGIEKYQNILTCATEAASYNE